jgi:hypothetical protein
MKKKLVEILSEQLVGKKIKLYKVSDKQLNRVGYEYFIVDKHDIIINHKKMTIIGESFGFIKSVTAEYDSYDGDFFNIVVVDEQMKELHVNGLYSLTNEIEIL